MEFKRFINHCIKTAVLALSVVVADGHAQAEGGEEAAIGRVSPMLFDHLRVDDGLSQSHVLSILQDRSGMMWFGTENGLNRYDGYEFKHFKRKRGVDGALTNDFINDMVEDAGGNLWLATDGGGLVRFDTRSERFTSYRHDANDAGSISGNAVRRLAIDADGKLWVATRGAGLNRFDPDTERFQRIAFEGVLDESASVYALLVDGQRDVWVGGDHGLTRIDRLQGSAQHFNHSANDSDSLAKGSVRALLRDTGGALWVATYGGGLSVRVADSTAFVTLKHDAQDASSLTGNRISSLHEDAAGRIWVGTTAGLNLVDPQSLVVDRFVKDSAEVTSLSGNNVTAIYQDRSGLMWFGTKTQGINKWNPRSWGFGFEPARALTADTQSKPNITSFAEDTNGKIWIGTFGDGLNVLDRTTRELIRLSDDEQSGFAFDGKRVMSLLYTRDNRLWIGTMRDGVSVIDFENGATRQYQFDANDPTSLSANGIMAMFEAADGTVWFGTFGGGISQFDAASDGFKRYQVSEAGDGLSSNRITSFAEDRSGKLWIGTDSGGLNLLDPQTGKVSVFRHDPDDASSLAADTVYSLEVARDGTVWVGTRGGGLDRVIGNARAPQSIRFTNLSEQDGLANDVVYGIRSDAAGWLWMSTNFGISRFNPGTGEFKNINRHDGLQSNEFNFGAHYQAPSGELFFGGHNGYNAFHPESLTQSSVAPLIALTGFFKGNDRDKADLPVDEDGTVVVDWKNNDVAFEFAALDFTASDQNRYQYKLEGFDEAWTDLGTQRRVTYTGLNDGQYVLRVRAANSEGIWNDAGLTLPLTVKPAPWDTWWAYLTYLAVALGSVSSLLVAHRRKIQREEAYSYRLEQEVRLRTERLAEVNDRLQKMNTSLQKSSLSDPLTGLRNRRFVFEEVSRDLELIQRRFNEQRDGTYPEDTSDLVFMMIDLDKFKPINDTYGHAAGDKMLLELRDVLLGICRRSDFVIRWGGDEFVVIAKQTRPEESEALAERIRASIDSYSFVLGDGQVAHTTCSIGFVAYPLFGAPAEDASLDQIIGIADGLMYEAKKQRNAWVGMHSPDWAVTSEGFDHEAIESTSLLFRARHAKGLTRYTAQPGSSDALASVQAGASK
ncbi:MAG: two-component regulator propeller domain-containing protein [Pseudomonadota bacterium]